MGLRISAGEYKGRKIKSPASGPMRPTSSKVRESVFNIIGERIKGAVFLDLYAGTGAVGFEAMSRGAEKVFFVESEGKGAERIEELLRGCGCRAKAVIVRGRAEGFLKKTPEVFDIVFLDPPYRSEEIQKVLPVLAGGSRLREGAFVIAEHAIGEALPEEAGTLRKKKDYRYGDTMLTLYVRN